MNKISDATCNSSYSQLLSRTLNFEVGPVLLDLVRDEAPVQAVSLLEYHFVSVRASEVPEVGVVTGFLCRHSLVEVRAEQLAHQIQCFWG